MSDFQEGLFQREPAFAVGQGRHEFDGKLPDWSPEGINGTVSWLHEQRTRAEGFKQLDERQRFEQQYLLSVIDGQLFWMENARQPFTNPGYYLDGGLDPATYLTRPYAPLETRLKAFVGYAGAIPKAAEQIRANLKPPLPRSFVKYGVDGFGGLPDFYRNDVPKVFEQVADPALKQQLTDAIGPAAQAMQGLADYLKQQEPTATEDFALGPGRFADMLRMTEGVTTPLAELEQVGRADLARNTEALKQACAQYRPGASIVDCIAAMNADKPAGGVVAGAREQLAGLRQLVVDKDLVSIPGTEEAQVAESPPYQRSNSAYIDIPGPYDKGMPSVYYISPPDPSWPKEEQEAYIPGKADLLFTSAHEVWPGHFLQFLHANRSPFEFGRLFVGYAYAEGWAHYTEELMWEAGLGAGSPEVHIGQLANALLRNVRYLCAIGLHTQGMTQQTCETMFREQGYVDPGNARQQAARGTYDPAYLNYTLGKLMIRKLRADWTAPRGGEKAWKQFHDTFLSYGGPPIPLVRAQMLGPAAGTPKDLF
ncbi:DUF885 domain-containing protein [Pseudonocardia eucalypti]|uniref:DUF885 domain-containing protein n=1 Tax=Pseudonocardia eucalypti TaxID=648755 RepID=A0ABP9R0C7_9PSEU|nr:hypothetical protein [Pseudonocardia eucalypti]